MCWCWMNPLVTWTWTTSSGWKIGWSLSLDPSFAPPTSAPSWTRCALTSSISRRLLLFVFICVETWNCIASLLHRFSIFQLPLVASMSIVVEARPWWTLRSLEGQKVEDLQGRAGHLLDAVRGEVPWEEGVARGYSTVFLRVLSAWLGGNWIKWTYTAITILL